MDSLVKVGSIVYKNGSIVSQRIHGAWYKKIKGKNGFEYEPVTEEESKLYNEIMDCLKMPLSESELIMMDHVRSIVETNLRMSPDDKKCIIEHVEEGIVMGLRKYGPYNPKSDTRDIRRKIKEKARNIIVYSIMLFMKDPDSAPVTNILIRQAMIIWSFIRIR